MARIKQVKNLTSLAALRSHLEGLGVNIPLDDEVDPAGALAQPLAITDSSAGTLAAPNRWAVLPMEGWDGEDDGLPSDLVRRRWDRFAASGAGLVWGEATAVRPDGRANPRQLVLTESTVDDLAALRRRLDSSQLAGLQLTHSGRFARPTSAGPAPRTAYEHPLLDSRVGAGAAEVLTDDELEELAEQFIDRAILTYQAGFDFVDIKACHGYLGHELLSAIHRPGPYGGNLRGRTRFLRTIILGIRQRAPGLGVAVRLSLFDFVPHAAGQGGVGTRESSSGYELAFGGDGSGVGIDLTETHQVLDMLEGLGVGLVCATAGSPYYVPHIQRPAYFPPSDGYQPPEDPLVGVARLIAATAEVAHRHPNMVVVAAGLSYLQEWLPNAAQALLTRSMAQAVGLGRMVLSYPHLPADVLAGRELNRQLLCRTFSDCTTAPRNGLISGCYPLDGFYNQREERIQLAEFKKEARAKMR